MIELHQNIHRIQDIHVIRRPRRVRTFMKSVALLYIVLSLPSLFLSSPKSRKLHTLPDGAGESCPFNLGQFIPPAVNRTVADDAVKFAREIDAETVVREALEKSVLKRKTIFVGDSVTRQAFSSLGCMLYKSGVINGVTDSYIAWQSNFKENDSKRQFNDARIRFWSEGKSNQIFYHPTGGMINTYGWGFEKAFSPMEGAEHWLQSCEKREPFMLDTYKLRKERGFHQFRFIFNEDDFEKVPLTRSDVVIFNAGIHPGTRAKNLENIALLADCMKEARSRGEAPIWPKLRYMRTSPQHFKSESGKWTAESAGLLCTEEDGEDPYFLEDLETIEGKLPILGKNMDLKHLSHLHLGFTDDKIDCTHWAMPGVPNLFVKVIMKTLINL